jgi:hypothetical protein
MVRLRLVEGPMKVPDGALRVLAVGFLFSSAVLGQAQTAEQPKFGIEIQVTGEHGPSYTVTNLTRKTVTACVIELSSSSESKQQSKMDWDSVMLDKPPIAPGASISQYLSHVVGGPLPDKAEVIAGIWDDGKTFGQIEWVDGILKNRTWMAAKYEEAASLLQQGLDQNWSRDQFLEAIGNKPKSGPLYGVQSTLQANRAFDERPKIMWNSMKRMMETFKLKAERLRQAKPLTETAVMGNAKPQ